MRKCRLLNEWNNLTHSEPNGSLPLVNEYLYKFLVYAYKHNIPITSKYLHNTREGDPNKDTMYDMYQFRIDFGKPSVFQKPVIFWPTFENYYMQLTVRSCKKPDSKRPIIEGIYDIYFGNSAAAEDCNCSYYDIAQENQIWNIAHQTVIYDLINKILANDKLNAWLILQGINVRSIL